VRWDPPVGADPFAHARSCTRSLSFWPVGPSCRRRFHRSRAPASLSAHGSAPPVRAPSPAGSWTPPVRLIPQSIYAHDPRARRGLRAHDSRRGRARPTSAISSGPHPLPLPLPHSHSLQSSRTHLTSRRASANEEIAAVRRGPVLVLRTPSSPHCVCYPGEPRLVTSNPRDPSVCSLSLYFPQSMLTGLSSTPQSLRHRRPEASPCPRHCSSDPKPSLKVTNLPRPYFPLGCPRLCAIAHQSETTPSPSHLIADRHPPVLLRRCCAHLHVRRITLDLPEPFSVP
jgi:hypothetical protein